jgi:hypothetical protein
MMTFTTILPPPFPPGEAITARSPERLPDAVSRPLPGNLAEAA